MRYLVRRKLTDFRYISLILTWQVKYIKKTEKKNIKWSGYVIPNVPHPLMELTPP
jgi:hypothetical protein